MNTANSLLQTESGKKRCAETLAAGLNRVMIAISVHPINLNRTPFRARRTCSLCYREGLAQFSESL